MAMMNLHTLVAVGLLTIPADNGSHTDKTPPSGPVIFTIVYDNYPGPDELKADWGFSCVIQGLEKTILFDTGTDGEILLTNMRQLNLDHAAIDVVVLSHAHRDHTGGLDAFLGKRTGIPVYLPTGFPPAFAERVKKLGAMPQVADEAVQICDGIRTTGTLGRGAIEEQGLCVRTPKGWMLVTGCAHPGVEKLAAKAKAVCDDTIFGAMGGFHLLPQPESRVSAVFEELSALGVEWVAPSHCSGDLARTLAKRRFGEGCTVLHVGSVVEMGKPASTPAGKT
jgi:7,8-dihydropterin-6-yl-methyl-4-(beta-D-ribofuranosyl)aminobenzene 5'-phosphate synthase